MKSLTGTTKCQLKNEKELLSKRPSSYTATISGAKKVYALFPGTVLFLGFYKNMGTLVMSVSNHEIVRYLNMKNIQAWTLQEINEGDYLGEPFSNPGLQFEYCTQWKGSSVYPVRTNNKLYYKQNPIDILNGLYIPEKEITIEPGITRPDDIITFTEDELKEWDYDIQDRIVIDPTAEQISNQWEIPQSARDMLSYNLGP